MVPKSRNVYQNVVLTVITVFLGVLAFKPAVHAPPVFAQTDPRYLYVEPGTTAVRAPDGSSQQQGKVFIDLKTGDIWGFPTLSGAPYPVDPTRQTPPVSKPVYLGRFDLSAIKTR